MSAKYSNDKFKKMIKKDAKRDRRTFTIQEKIEIVERILNGKLEVNMATDSVGAPIHYGIVENWVNSYLAGKFKKARNQSGAYVKTGIRKVAAMSGMEPKRKIKTPSDSGTISEEDIDKLVNQKLMALMTKVLDSQTKGKVKKSPNALESIQRRVFHKD